MMLVREPRRARPDRHGRCDIGGLFGVHSLPRRASTFRGLGDPKTGWLAYDQDRASALRHGRRRQASGWTRTPVPHGHWKTTTFVGAARHRVDRGIRPQAHGRSERFGTMQVPPASLMWSWSCRDRHHGPGDIAFSMELLLAAAQRPLRRATAIGQSPRPSLRFLPARYEPMTLTPRKWTASSQATRLCATKRPPSAVR